MQTLYSENATIKIQVRKELFRKYKKKLAMLDYLKSTKQISRPHHKRGNRRLHGRIENLVDDEHYKLAQFLTMNFQTIFLPNFESQKVAQKMYGKESRSNLMSLKHYRFRCRLIDRCKLVKHSQVQVCTEEYTSKTCGRCGTLCDVGSSEVYSCNNCALRVDRDVNGARNIGIKNLKELQLL